MSGGKVWMFVGTTSEWIGWGAGVPNAWVDRPDGTTHVAATAIGVGQATNAGWGLAVSSYGKAAGPVVGGVLGVLAGIISGMSLVKEYLTCPAQPYHAKRERSVNPGE